MTDGEGDIDVDTWQSDENRLEAIGRITIYGVRHSLAHIIADALVSNDDATGAMRGRSAARLKQVGGAEIESESLAVHQGLGDAWLTNPGMLRARHVIHVGLLDADDSTSEALIRGVMVKSLKLADDKKLTSIAFPALGTGRSGFPMFESARIVRDAIETYLESTPKGTVSAVAFVLFFPQELTEFRRGFSSAGGSSQALDRSRSQNRWFCLG